MGWGFYAHRQINRLAVFTLPVEMIAFYKRHIDFITDNAVNPDKRRFIIEAEAPRHYIDIDHYGDSAIESMPRFWKDAEALYGNETLQAYGILPWNTVRVYYQLRDAFAVGDPEKVLRLSADLGHYIADAHVPLHTTENYDGQFTGQSGIHAFWESRLPELYGEQYNFFVGRASYIKNPQLAIWNAVTASHAALDSVLGFERALYADQGKAKFSFETKGRQTQKVVAQEYAAAYHTAMHGMVERRMRAAVKMVGDFWYSAWVEAGQPDLKVLIDYQPTQQELVERRAAFNAFKKDSLHVRTHE